MGAFGHFRPYGPPANRATSRSSTPRHAASLGRRRRRSRAMEGFVTVFFWQHDLDPAFPLSVLEYETRDADDQMHWHEYLEIALCLQGGGQFPVRAPQLSGGARRCLSHRRRRAARWRHRSPQPDAPPPHPLPPGAHRGAGLSQLRRRLPLTFQVRWTPVRQPPSGRRGCRLRAPADPPRAQDNLGPGGPGRPAPPRREPETRARRPGAVCACQRVGTGWLGNARRSARTGAASAELCRAALPGEPDIGAGVGARARERVARAPPVQGRDERGLQGVRHEPASLGGEAPASDQRYLRAGGGLHGRLHKPQPVLQGVPALFVDVARRLPAVLPAFGRGGGRAAARPPVGARGSRARGLTRGHALPGSRTPSQCRYRQLEPDRLEQERHVAPRQPLLTVNRPLVTLPLAIADPETGGEDRSSARASRVPMRMGPAPDRESSMPSFPHLFSPIQLGGLELPNRVVHVPTDISSSHADGEVSERDIHHHTDIARGGAGFVIVGATTPDSTTGRPTVTCLVADGDNYIPGLARLAEGMHRYGAKCAVQLQHPGRQCAIPRYNTLGATDRVLKLPWSAGHEIIYENAEEKGKEIRAASIVEILELVDLFSEAAWRVKQAGFDAVELHAAHGYLLSEFMSPFLNQRNDRFGGSLENRMRFPLAVVDSIQKKCGKAYPILVRYSFDEWYAGGRGAEEGVEIARVLERAGCAAVDLSMGMQESPGAGFDPMQYPQGWATYAAEATKKAIRIPVITSHSLRDPAYCDQIIAEGKTDLVGLARQLLADPYWPVKAQYGRVRSIRKCISCLGGCWQESLMAKHEIACSINAACGNPAYAEMKRTTKAARVAVVGGGPAGMEAARIATERGHTVTLFEKAGELGGALLYCCLVPDPVQVPAHLL